MYDSFFRPNPAQLGVGDEVAPCLAPVCDEGGEGAAFDAVSDVVDCFADDVVSAANSEGLFENENQHVFCERGRGRGRKGGVTMPWPEKEESVFRIQ